MACACARIRGWTRHDRRACCRGSRAPGRRPGAAVIPSLFVVLVLAGSAFATSFISGILGMAGGMILIGVLLVLLPLPAAMLLHGLVQLAANGWRAFLLRTEIDWRVFGGYAVGGCVALALFAILRFVVDKP